MSSGKQKATADAVSPKASKKAKQQSSPEDEQDAFPTEAELNDMSQEERLEEYRNVLQALADIDARMNRKSWQMEFKNELEKIHIADLTNDGARIVYDDEDEDDCDEYLKALQEEGSDGSDEDDDEEDDAMEYDLDAFKEAIGDLVPFDKVALERQMIQDVDGLEEAGPSSAKTVPISKVRASVNEDMEMWMRKWGRSRIRHNKHAKLVRSKIADASAAEDLEKTVKASPFDSHTAELRKLQWSPEMHALMEQMEKTTASSLALRDTMDKFAPGEQPTHIFVHDEDDFLTLNPLPGVTYEHDNLMLRRDFCILPKMAEALKQHQREGVNMVLKMYPYQSALISWLMGLGKTAAAIAVIDSILYHYLNEGKIAHVIVIAPASLIGNWKAEFAKFQKHTCGWSHYCYVNEKMGMQESSFVNWKVHGGVIVMSYQAYTKFVFLVSKGEVKMHSLNFVLRIFDEIHTLRNEETQTFKTCANKTQLSIPTLGLTGTPIQNGVEDLWTLFNLLCPRLLRMDNLKEFKTRYAKMVDGEIVQSWNLEADGAGLTLDVKEYAKGEYQPATEMMRLMLDAFSIRQGPDVLNEMLHEAGASLTEFVVYFNARKPLSNSGSEFQKYHAQVAATIDERVALGTWLTKQLMQQGHYVLVMATHLDILDKVKEKLQCRYICGSTSTSDREKLLDEFNSLTAPGALCLSQGVGQCGLNITRADRVLLLDASWNPASDIQAIARSYRMGQTHDVVAYRVACNEAIETRILRKQIHKLSIAGSILDDTPLIMDASDMNNITCDADGTPLDIEKDVENGALSLDDTVKDIVKRTIRFDSLGSQTGANVSASDRCDIMNEYFYNDWYLEEYADKHVNRIDNNMSDLYPVHISTQTTPKGDKLSPDPPVLLNTGSDSSGRFIIFLCQPYSEFDAQVTQCGSATWTNVDKVEPIEKPMEGPMDCSDTTSISTVHKFYLPEQADKWITLIFQVREKNNKDCPWSVPSATVPLLSI